MWDHHHACKKKGPTQCQQRVAHSPPNKEGAPPPCVKKGKKPCGGKLTKKGSKKKGWLKNTQRERGYMPRAQQPPWGGFSRIYNLQIC